MACIVVAAQIDPSYLPGGANMHPFNAWYFGAHASLSSRNCISIGSTVSAVQGPRSSQTHRLHTDRQDIHMNSPLLALRAAICGRKVELFHRRDLPSPHRELKCADTIGTVRAGSLGWPFPVLKY